MSSPEDNFFKNVVFIVGLFAISIMATGGAALNDGNDYYFLFFMLVFCPIILSLFYSLRLILPFGEKNWNYLFVPLSVLCWFMSLAMMAYSWDFWIHILSKLSDSVI